MRRGVHPKELRVTEDLGDRIVDVVIVEDDFEFGAGRKDADPHSIEYFVELGFASAHALSMCRKADRWAFPRANPHIRRRGSTRRDCTPRAEKIPGGADRTGQFQVT